MQKLIKTTCKIAAEDIGRERAKHIAEKAQGFYLSDLASLLSGHNVFANTCPAHPASTEIVQF